MYSFLSDFVIPLDQKFFFVINQWHHPWVDTLVYYVTHQFFWIPLYISLVYLIFITFRTKAWQTLLIIICLMIICDQFSSSLVKPLIQRIRPCLHPDFAASVHVVGQYHGVYGFISSHATNTFGLATFLWLLLRKQYPSIKLLFIWAFGISYARIYGGVHYPMDIIMGALSGILWANIMFKCYMHSPTAVSICK